MSSNSEKANASNGWRECTEWLTRCGALRSDHKANWPNATAFDLAYTLRDGVLLCNLLNTVDPGCVDMKDVNQKPQLAQFLCLRNIKIFLSACSSVFGLSDSELFEPSMLFDLSNFHRVLCTLSALSVCPRLRLKGIEGFSIGRDRSQEEIYKNLQSEGVGREDEGRRRRFRRREGNEAGSRERDEDPVQEEDGYGDYYCHLQSEEIYQDLCSLRSPLKVLPASRAEKRDHVIKELVETERNYSELLTNLIRFFSEPLSAYLRPKDWKCVFFGINELSTIHNGFYNSLSKFVNGEDLAQAFLDWRERFIIYGDYCANLTVARNTLEEICSRDGIIDQEVIRCEDRAKDGRFKLWDLLSVPMQRILKYHLLLDKLVEETPMEWTEDRRQLIKAREAMLDVAQCINDVKRDSDSLDVIRQIQASIVEWNNSGDLRLEDFGRLLKDDELRVRHHSDQRTKTRWAFVFEQAILICKIGRGDQYCYREILRLDDYRLDHNNTRSVTRDFRWSHQWLLVHKRAHTAYTLFAKTEDQKKVWMKVLREAMDTVHPAACKSTDHKFKLTTFDIAQSCSHCLKFLKGRIFQGYKCTSCFVSVHKQCIMYSGCCTPVAAPPPPPPPPPFDRNLCPREWFVGEMDRSAAEMVLQYRRDGTYLLRVRPYAQNHLKHETNYVLSMKMNGAVRHTRVFNCEREGVPSYCLSAKRSFKSIVELVKYYERNSLAENFVEALDERLMWPVHATRMQNDYS